MTAELSVPVVSLGPVHPNPSHRQTADDLQAPARTPGLTLKDYVEREFAAIATAGGPTMTDILADLDELRGADSPNTHDIVEALHEGRARRLAHLDDTWQQ